MQTVRVQCMGHVYVGRVTESFVHLSVGFKFSCVRIETESSHSGYDPLY